VAYVGFASQDTLALPPFTGYGAEVASPPTPNRADVQDNKIRILLVDDNKVFLRAATEFLQRHDEVIIVGAICGGEEVLTQAQELRTQVILVGLDKSGLAGLEIVSRLRDALPGVGIIALTLLEGNTYRQAALAAGTDDVVRKAELTTDLLAATQRVTQTKRSPR
jgi:DNA-binding NarL/FixJ family response regulator